MVKGIISSLFPELELQAGTNDPKSGVGDENGGTDIEKDTATKKTIILSIVKPTGKTASTKEITLSIVKPNKHT